MKTALSILTLAAEPMLSLVAVDREAGMTRTIRVLGSVDQIF